MGKKLIGTSLGNTMVEILLGNVAEEDIEKIYAGTCITEETIPSLIKEYESKWRMVAFELAGKEVLEKYGLKDYSQIHTIKDRVKMRQIREEYDADVGEEKIELVIEKAEALLHRLWNDKKINQIRYRVPKEQTVMVKNIESLDEKQSRPVTGDGRLVVALINGEYYWYDGGVTTVSFGAGRFFNSELALIANKLFSIIRASFDIKKGGFNCLKKMFPQYEAVLDKLSDKLGIYDEELMEVPYLDEDKILAMLQEALTQEHTAEEIGDDLLQVPDIEKIGGEALAAVTEFHAKKPTGPDDH